MKHFTLFALFIAAMVLGANAQTTIYTQNFATFPPAGWTNVDNTGTTAGTWTRVTTAGPLFTTRSNGYAIFDSDGLGNDGKPEDATLSSGAIDCSGHSHVALEFQSLFAQYAASEGKVSVSNDGTNWTEVYSVVNSSTVNPEIVRIDISNIAANQTTVYIRFNYTGDWDNFWAVDDIKVYEHPTLEITLDKLTNERYVGLSDQHVTGVVVNNGATVINSFDLTYTDNGGAAVSQNFSGLSILPFQSYSFSMPQIIAMSTPTLHVISATVSSPNGGADFDITNNTAQTEVSALSAIAEKNVLMEEFTTCQCGWCPAGHFIASQIENQYPYFIPVNIHAGFGTDAMTITDASTLAAAFANGAPTANVDRVFWPGEEKVAISRGDWENRTVERHAKVTPATVAATSTYDDVTRNLSVDVTAKFFGVINGNFRVNCYLIEDSVAGTGSGYNQSNYLSGTNGFQSYPAYSLPNPIVGYFHRHVQRRAFGGAWGSAAVIPATTADGGEYTKNYTFTIPAGVNTQRCKLVAFVHEYNSTANSGKNEVFNVVELPLNGSATQSSTPSVYVSGVADLQSSLSSVALYPNPASDLMNIEFNLSSDSYVGFEIYNMLGQSVYTVPQTNLAKGGFRVPVNTSTFENGVYFVVVKDGNKVANTLKFVVSK